MIDVNFDFPSPGAFVYDKSRPTYYTEFLSWSLHQHQYALSQAGAKNHVETVPVHEQMVAVLQAGASLASWLDSSIDLVSAWLNSADGSPPPGDLPAFPDLPEVLTQLAVLLPGGKLALAAKLAIPAVKAVFKFRELQRPRDLVRLLDKALLRDSFFLGIRKSWLEVIAEKMPSEYPDWSALLKARLVIDGVGREFTIAEILGSLLKAFVTQDCEGVSVGLTDFLRRVLAYCVPVADGNADFITLQDTLQSLVDALSACSVEVETEKAARVRLSGVDTSQGSVPFPSNL